jgi:hypothetical protein
VKGRAGVPAVAAALLALAAAAILPSAAAEVLRLGPVEPAADAAAPPAGWESLTFTRVERPTAYRMVREAQGWVLRAESHAGASALYRPVDLDPRVWQVLSWRWKVENVLSRSDPRTKAGDDYAARVYVAFAYDPAAADAWERLRFGVLRALYGRYPPRHALSYVWDARLPVGTTLDSAYTDRAKIIVLRSGPAEVGRWVEERRNVYQDYRRLVGAEPPRLAGIAVMTDTDDTGERAVAYYGELALGRGD